MPTPTISRIYEIYGIAHRCIQKYMMVCRYADKEDLKHYLSKNFATLNWKPRLKILRSTISDLISIHNKRYIHRDIHSGNTLLFSNDVIRGGETHICDLGWSKKTDRSIVCGERYGVLPYIAPGVLLNKRYKKNQKYTVWVQKFAPETPDCYIQLSNRCTNANPTKRPTADKLNEFLVSDRIIPTLSQYHINATYKVGLLKQKSIDPTDLRDLCGS
ncbi:kinase-like domain-containing protein [Gigaspora rosea]|uniref:Kinase-like domain-containing protein n=1 Tax=Gigaspora rosea TaxID=44941 RepID=A0A397VFA6_9GLOM|nr:kinase-like domain-containing protein [Gigaspora rosea]